MAETGAIWDVRRYGEIDSTNRELVDLARAGAPDGVVVVAEHQTAGRGRLGRRWEAPPGASLLVSVLLRRPAPHRCVVAVALAAADACEEVAGLRPRLKWPNDLVVGDRKIGGILAELPAPGSVVVGVGVNLNWPAQLPPELAEVAVSLNHAVGHPVDREAVLERLLDRLAARLDHPALLADYRRDCATLGRDVRVELHDEVVHGRAVGVTEEGHLLVRVGDHVRAIAAGDVVHLRPAPSGERPVA